MILRFLNSVHNAAVMAALCLFVSACQYSQPQEQSDGTVVKEEAEDPESREFYRWIIGTWTDGEDVFLTFGSDNENVLNGTYSRKTGQREVVGQFSIIPDEELIVLRDESGKHEADVVFIHYGKMLYSGNGHYYKKCTE